MKRLVDIKALLRFELSTSYRHPSLEFLFASVVLFSAFGASSLAFQSLSFRFSPKSPIINPDLFADFLSAVQLLREVSFVAGVRSVYYLLIILIPIISAFTIASSLENGSLATLLSYPIGRRSVLLVRVLFPIAFLSVFTFLCSLVWVAIFLPGFTDLGFCFLVFALSCTTMMFVFLLNSLIAIITKKASISVVGGLLLGMSFLQLGYTSNTILAGVLDPFTSLISVLTRINNELSFLDIIVSMGIQISLAISLLVVQLLIINKMEVQ